MNKLEMKRKFSMTKLKLKKTAPKICMIASIAGFAFTVIDACRQTTKLQAILDERDEKLDEIADNQEDVEEYTAEDAKHDISVIHVQTGFKIAKLYARDVAMFGVSTFLNAHGYKELNARAVGASAAASSIMNAFSNYRARVANEIGKEKEEQLYYGIKEKEAEVTTTNAKTGKTKTEKKTIRYFDAMNAPERSFWFDSSSVYWTEDPVHNISFLKTTLVCLNNRLQAYGYLWENDVRHALGLPETVEGHVNGWLYLSDKQKESGLFDNINIHGYIDFGLPDSNNSLRSMAQMDSPNVLISLNVDGPIYYKMQELEEAIKNKPEGAKE